MSTGGIVAVTSGIHAGASVMLSEGHELTIGSGEGESLVLIDEGIASHHATVCLEGNRLKLTAYHEGVSVFGYRLATGKSTVLRYGAFFSVGEVKLQFGGRESLSPEVVRDAELAWLMAHAPLAYVARRWAWLPRGTKLMLLILIASAGLWSLRPMFGPHDRERSLPRLDGTLRFVTVHEDATTHGYVYEGYVPTGPDLASLTAIAHRAGHSPVMRVFVVEQLRDQLADFLQKYYRDAQIESDERGGFAVALPPEDSYTLPESWDYRRVARLARESINGLRDLRFKGHEADTGPVRIPLEAIGMNLARSAHGAWLVDAAGVRYFAGARVPIGRIASISGCTVTIVRNDDGTTYEFSANGVGNAKCN